jgi:hypothetical protein
MKQPLNTISTEIADVWIDSQRIVHIFFKESERHGIEEAQEVVRAHNQLADGVPVCVLADIRTVKVGADRAARKHYVSAESAEFKSGMAMLVSSPMQRMLGNIFLMLNQPPYPTRLFSEEEEALQWLAQLNSES